MALPSPTPRATAAHAADATLAALAAPAALAALRNAGLLIRRWALMWRRVEDAQPALHSLTAARRADLREASMLGFDCPRSHRRNCTCTCTCARAINHSTSKFKVAGLNSFGSVFCSCARSMAPRACHAKARCKGCPAPVTWKRMPLMLLHKDNNTCICVDQQPAAGKQHGTEKHHHRLVMRVAHLPKRLLAQ